MADYTITEIMSRLQNGETPTAFLPMTPPALQGASTDCPDVVSANEEFTAAFNTLMSYWNPFQAIINSCSGPEDGTKPNTLNARTKICDRSYPCSSFSKNPNPDCSQNLITSETIAHSECWKSAYTQWQTCVSTGVNNNSLLFYKDKIKESLAATNTAYSKLQAAQRDCKILRRTEIGTEAR